MNRIKAKFDILKAQHETALIPYITAGDPNPSVTVPLMHALVTAGADMIELGVPFSDPMADGPVIEAAHQRALHHRVCLQDVIDMVREFRETNANTPIILMGYLNPFEKMGYQRFAKNAQAAGVDGVLTVDLPPEEAKEWLQELDKVSLDPIFLISPTTTTERIKLICEKARGYLYYVSLKGVTGAKSLDVEHVAAQLTKIRSFTSLPIAVGFGIKNPQSAASVAEVADAVIVGSALIAQMAALPDQTEIICNEISILLQEMRVAIDMKDKMKQDA